MVRKAEYDRLGDRLEQVQGDLDTCEKSRVEYYDRWMEIERESAAYKARAEEAEARVAEAERLLRAAAARIRHHCRGTTHYDACELDHDDCLILVQIDRHLTADSASAVEMQPGSPNFDGAAAYERYLDATTGEDKGTKP